jgi:hypothetical protein
MKLALKGAKLSMSEAIPDNFDVIRRLPHGHVDELYNALDWLLEKQKD